MGYHVAWWWSHPSLSGSGWAASCIWGLSCFCGLENCSTVSVYASPVPPVTGQSPFSVIFWGLKKTSPIHSVRPMAWEDLRWVVPG